MANLRNLLYSKNMNDKNFDAYAFLTMEKINAFRNEFYKVLLELFAFYKDLVRKDQQFGEVTFDVKNFLQMSNKEFRQFYQDFFYANCDGKHDKLNNQVFLNFISK
jgi:hypothetical protein